MLNINWSTINAYGKLRFSKSSYSILVIVPILVKLTEYINSPLILNIGTNQYSLNLELPFSWYIFYFGAISIAIGTFIYQVFCPSFIKKYSNYGVFLDSGESDSYLIDLKEKYAENKEFSFIGNESRILRKVELLERRAHPFQQQKIELLREQIIKQILNIKRKERIFLIH